MLWDVKVVQIKYSFAGGHFLFSWKNFRCIECHLSFIYKPFAKCVTLGKVNQNIRMT